MSTDKYHGQGGCYVINGKGARVPADAAPPVEEPKSEGAPESGAPLINDTEATVRPARKHRS